MTIVGALGFGWGLLRSPETRTAHRAWWDRLLSAGLGVSVVPAIILVAVAVRRSGSPMRARIAGLSPA